MGILRLQDLGVRLLLLTFLISLRLPSQSAVAGHRSRSVKLLLVLASTSASWLLVPSGPITIIFFSRFLRVLRWSLLFNDRRGLTTTGHSPCTGDDSSGHSLINWPSPPHTHTHTHTHTPTVDTEVTLLFQLYLKCHNYNSTNLHSPPDFRVFSIV
jgi:hypothetical protein